MSLKSKVEKLPFYNQAVLPWHLGQAIFSSVRYGRPAKNLRVIGVTGTNGKTTACFMIWQMLNDAGYKTGLLTTVAWGGVPDSQPNSAKRQSTNELILDGHQLHPQYEHMTTERVGVLNARMRAIADAGAEFLVLEVTSHAMAQFRTLGVPIEIAVFTNLTHDHLDYHKTFENYRKAKLKLFKKAQHAVINADDKNANFFAHPFTKKYLKYDIKENISYSSSDIISYGIKHGNLQATDIELNPTGIKYSCHDMRNNLDIHGENKIFPIKTQIPGKFNVYNSLAAVGVGKFIGLTNQQISHGIASLNSVEGRMTRIQAGQDFEVIVDYAHAPDALEKVFASIKPQNDESKIISVHGGAGKRDHSTREPRGEILGQNSDIVIITEDDSRDENPQEIADMFVKGAKKAGKTLDQDLFVILDREQAIKKALDLAEPGDIVLILGKGHEKTILRNDGPHNFEDIKITKKLLKEQLKSPKKSK